MCPAEVAGNIGRPLTASSTRSTRRVGRRELSSFQLEDVESLRPRVAVLLNLEPDHIDRHGTSTLRARRSCASSRARSRRRGGRPARLRRRAGFRARRTEFAADDPLPADPPIPGTHNRENSAAATAAARAAGLTDEAIAAALRTFPGVEHRIQELATVAGVRYVNDSKATNVAAALRALASLPGERKHVILGGLGKNERYSRWAEHSAPMTARTSSARQPPRSRQRSPAQASRS